MGFEGTCILVFGAPNSGKSVFCKHLASQHKDECIIIASDSNISKMLEVPSKIYIIEAPPLATPEQMIKLCHPLS
jgi:uridine kinase